ncbi:MAG: GNAT family N-acetyltransferase [Acetobacteraceae bacterium]
MIRRALAAETDTVRDVVCAAYAPYIPRIGKPPGPMLDDYARRIAAGEAWVLDEGGRIVGVLVLEQTADGFLLDNIAVLPDCQGKGFGHELLLFAEAEARRGGFAEVRLYTHALMTENIALYRRIGFVETHNITENGYDRVYMAKRL